MVKFAHLADCHLGSWRLPSLQDLNFKSFQKAIDIILTEKVDFVLICGDLFDSAYPSIEILKETFAEFRRINDANIPVYLIAGSHDYSASGKTFLDVLEKAGFCKNMEKFEIQDDNSIKLIPYIHDGIAIYGYSGKKSGLEIEELKRVYFSSVNPYTIFMLHTTINEVAMENMPSINKINLPLAQYYALGHIHQVRHLQDKNQHFIYPGPIFPNNFQELVDLKCGSFQITEINDKLKTYNIKLPLKEVVYIELELDNGIDATEKIINELDRYNLNDKILLLKLKGTLLSGKTGDINFGKIEEFIDKKKAFAYLRNISQLKTIENNITVNENDFENIEKIEKTIIEEFSNQNPNEFNKFLPQIMNSLSIEKNDDEKNAVFEDRIIDELRVILNMEKIL
ncbi:MAG: DNA repair exonuclease [Candidatus Nanoarchaeia archaeon]|nr:DNA repair exonuclease [Candidatus Nanoarchaeia archaeon]